MIFSLRMPRYSLCLFLHSESCEVVYLTSRTKPVLFQTHAHTQIIDYEVIVLNSPRQPTETITQNPSYMPNTDASINYEGEMYSYIDPEDVRILARIPIVSQDEIKTEQVAISSNIATANNICYGSAIPRDHSDQVPTSDNVAYGSTVR